MMARLTEAQRAELLRPPAECEAHGDAKMRDHRKGSFWFCPLAGKTIGVGRVRPACLCSQALGDAGRAALKEGTP